MKFNLMKMKFYFRFVAKKHSFDLSDTEFYENHLIL